MNWSFCLVILLVCLIFPAEAWDNIDFEIFDAVEDVNENFYTVLGVSQTASQAEIRRAYRKLSLTLHPDRNKEPDAEEKFRKLVSVSDILKDEEKRKRYDIVLQDGLPNWKQPIFYYRRVRKMGLLEFSVLLFCIMTLGHYILLWSIYLEKKFELEELVLSKKKSKKTKRKQQSSAVDEVDDDFIEETTGVTRPQLLDLLPIKTTKWLVIFFKTLPERYQKYQEQLEQQRLANEEEARLTAESEKHQEDSVPRPKRRRHVNTLPEIGDEDDQNWEGAPVTNITSSLDRNEDDRQQRSTSDGDFKQWTEIELSLLAKFMAKYPGGSANRWEKIANDMGRPVEEVTKYAKKAKTSYAITVSAEVQGTTGSIGGLGGKKALVDPKDNQITESYDWDQMIEEAYEWQNDEDYDNKKKKRSRRKGGNTAVTPSEDLPPVVEKLPEQIPNGIPVNQELNRIPKKEDVLIDHSSSWTQTQQKLFEVALAQFPKTTPDRWTCIARAVPGKTKENCILRFKYLAEKVKMKKQQIPTAQLS